MKPALIRLGFLLISAALHALGLALLWGVDIAPRSPIKVELIPLARRPGELDTPRQRAPVTTPPRRPSAPAKYAGDGVSFEPPVRPRLLPHRQLTLPELDLGREEPAAPTEEADGPRGVTDASAYGPGDARLTVLLRGDRVRDTRYAATVARLLALFPDHRTLAARTGLDPLRDFDSILISTADPFDVTATFLAARHHLGDAALRRRFDAQAARSGGRVRWRTVGGRPVGVLPPAPIPGRFADARVLVLPRPGVAVFTRPEHVAALVAAQAPRRDADGGTDADAWPALSVLAADADADPDGPALLVSLSDVGSFVAAAPGETMPIPREVRLMVQGLRREPAAYLELTFADAKQAARFAASWPARGRALAASPFVYFLGLRGLIQRIEVQARDDAVRARARMTPEELQQLLRLLIQLGPPPPPASQPASRPAGRPAGAGARPGGPR